MLRQFISFAFLLIAAATCSADLLRALSFEEGSPAFLALFNPAVGTLEASLAIRYLYVQAIARYEVAAACNGKALSFFGTRDPISQHLCTPVNRALIRAYTLYRINRDQFPIEAAPFGSYLRSINLSPDDNSKNIFSPSGWANFVANRANRYLSNDGWNSQGDTSIPSPLRNAYGDTTGFIPTNKAETPADELPRPLRWQPLVQKSASTGGFKAQVFSTPQLGRVKPLALTPRGVARRKTRAPFSKPDNHNIVGQDLQLMRRQLDDFLSLSQGLTVKQRFLARWWENKRISLLSFLPFYAKKLQLSEWQETFIELAQRIAMHDSIIVAWKEKRKHNAVRPTTMIKRFFSGKTIRVFISEKDGSGKIPGEYYQPLFPVQSHPEYPSGSALLCTTALDALKQALMRTTNGSIPPYELRAGPGMFGFPHKKQIMVSYSSLSDAAKECGQSRLWAGVHFPPSIEEGEEVAKGIGISAYKHVAELVAGIVPQFCTRCL